MSVTDPKYSQEPIADGIEHLAHWLHVTVHDTVVTAVIVIHRGIVVTDDLKAQLPTLGEETAAVAGDVLQCKSLAAAIALMVSGGGTNPAADLGVLGALVTDAPALIRLFSDSAKLLKTAGADIKTDAEAIAGSN